MAKNITRHVSHLKSSGSTAPAAVDLLYGEIAVGYGKNNEALYIKNSSDEIVTFTNAAGAIALAELYTDKHVISTVTGDTEITASLSAAGDASGRTLTITHASGSAQSGFKKLSSDAYGHITGGTNVALSDLTGLGAVSSARTITTASGLTGGGNLSADRTIGLEATGTSGTYAKVVTDAYGRVTSGSATITESDVTNLTTDLAGKVGTARTITTASGLTGGGNLSADLTIGHSNNITAGSAKTSTTAATTITTANTAIDFPVIEYDENGHITSTGSSTVNLKVGKASTSAYGTVKVATTTGTNNTDVVMTQSAVTKAIEDSFAAQDAMVYKGLVGSGTNYGFPTTFNKGYTYKVATAFTINSVAYEIGDMFIANTDVTTAENYTAAHWDAIQTNLDPTVYANTATTVTGASGLTGGGNIGSNVVIGHATAFTESGQTTPNAAQTPAFNGTFNVPVIQYDEYGHITAATTTTVKIPASASTWSRNYYTSGLTVTTATTSNTITVKGTNSAVKGTAVISAATTSAAGLMSSGDKTVLDNITPLTGNASTLSAITASSTAINSLTGSVGTMAFQNTSSYSSATQVNTALSGKSDTGHTHDGTYATNAFSKVKINAESTTIDADSTGDTLTVSGGTFISLTSDATNDKFTINVNTGTSNSTVAVGNHTHSSYENQNAFSNIKVGSITVAAASATDTVEFSGDTAISIVGTNGAAGADKITFSLGDIVCGDYA